MWIIMCNKLIWPVYLYDPLSGGHSQTPGKHPRTTLQMLQVQTIDTCMLLNKLAKEVPWTIFYSIANNINNKTVYYNNIQL